MYGHRQRPEDTECEASMAYTGSTCISLKEKKMEALKQICGGSVHKIPTTGLNAKGEDSGVKSCYCSRR